MRLTIKGGLQSRAANNRVNTVDLFRSFGPFTQHSQPCLNHSHAVSFSYSMHLLVLFIHYHYSWFHESKDFLYNLFSHVIRV